MVTTVVTNQSLRAVQCTRGRKFGKTKKEAEELIARHPSIASISNAESSNASGDCQQD